MNARSASLEKAILQKPQWVVGEKHLYCISEYLRRERILTFLT